MNNAAIDMDETARVFIAATPAEWLPTRVLEFSIRETASLPVEVSALYTFRRSMPLPKAVENRPRTPFSFQRFLIPELCSFAGKAIYLDADMQVFRDVAELWRQPLNGNDLQTVREAGKGRRGQFSVMLLDCERLRWNVDEIVAALDAGTLDYAGLMYEMRATKKIGRDIPPEWNSLETYEPRKTALLHYTDMNTQPWVSLANPLSYLWVSCLRRALAAGFINEGELQREISAGHVRPSLVPQIQSGIDSCIDLPKSIRRLDSNFVAPYRRLRAGRARPWTSASSWMVAAFRRIYYSSRLPALFR